MQLQANDMLNGLSAGEVHQYSVERWLPALRLWPCCSCGGSTNNMDVLAHRAKVTRTLGKWLNYWATLAWHVYTMWMWVWVSWVQWMIIVVQKVVCISDV